jgi:hypothetical protein
MSELINYSPDLKQRKIGVRESFESKCTYSSLFNEFVCNLSFFWHEWASLKLA